LSISKCAINVSLTLSLSLIGATPSHAEERMARNLITVATGSVPENSDPRVLQVSRQLDRIEALCAVTSRGAEIGDKIAFSHSRLKVRQSIFTMLNGFEEIARNQCGSIDSATLLGLYVLERNEGSSHANTVHNVSRRPAPLIRKWSSRPSK
jgi:hypothetical protein